MYAEFVARKYKKATIVFDGYSTQQTTKAATHVRRHGTSVQVNFTGDMILQDTREKFLANPSNKQRFINLLSETLMKLGFQIHHAKDDADCLIVKTTLDVAASSTTVLIGEDTDLLVLLLYHVTDNLHGVYFMPSGRKAKLWDIKTTRAKIGTETCKRLLFAHAITGCDTTSRMMNIGKSLPVKLLRKSTLFQKIADVFMAASTHQEIEEAGEKAVVLLYGGDTATSPFSPFTISDVEPLPGSRPWDVVDPFFTYAVRVLMQRLLKCYVRQFVVFVGIIGNGLCCAVFFQQGLTDRINLMLFWLAVADLGNLLSHMLLMPGCYLADVTQVNNWSVVVNAKISYINWWMGHLSGMLIVLVSVHRCLSVALPLKARSLLGYRPTVAGIVACYVVSLAIFLPSLLVHTVSWTTDPSTNRTVASLVKTPWFPLDSALAVNIVYNFLLVALPAFTAVMVVCCTVTIVHLRRASRQRLKMTGTVTEDARAGQNRITVMLLVICGVYIVLALPETIFGIIVVVIPRFYGKYYNTTLVTYQFIWLAACLNSASNFFVYCVLSSRFQGTLKSFVVALSKKSLQLVK
ncbi:hypothetical protein ACOMHN_022561 [Nucella lapillus]